MHTKILVTFRCMQVKVGISKFIIKDIVTKKYLKILGEL